MASRCMGTCLFLLARSPHICELLPYVASAHGRDPGAAVLVHICSGVWCWSYCILPYADVRLLYLTTLLLSLSSPRISLLGDISMFEIPSRRREMTLSVSTKYHI